MESTLRLSVSLAIALSAAAALNASARGACVGCAKPSFGPGFQRFGLAGAELQFAVSDFDHDGLLDVAASSGQLGGSLAILRGDGRGGFFPEELVPIGGGHAPDALVAADLNGDGFDDLVGAELFSNDVRVFLANGLGGFLSPTSYPAALSARRLHAADLDGDGDDDIVAALGGVVSVLLAGGQGGLAAPLLIAVPAGATDVAIGDFDEDGELDLAAAGNSVSVLLGDGAGGFAPGPVSPLSDPARLILPSRLDADAHLDLVLSLGGFVVTPSLEVLRGDGNGGFTSSQTIDEGVQSPPLALGDVDGNGNVDLLVGGLLKVYPGNGDGTFAQGPIETNVLAQTLAAKDMMGDGVPDAVVVQSGVYVVPGRAGSGLELPPSVPSGASPAVDFAAVHVDLSGTLDVVVPQSANGTVSVFLGAGDGSFATGTEYAAGPSARFVIPVALDDDMNNDLVVVDDNGVSVLLGVGQGAFGPPTDFAAGASPARAALGEFNGDGMIDVVVVGSELAILFGDGQGGFGPPSIVANGNGHSVAVGPLDADAAQDLVVASGSDLLVYLGHGDGTFDDPATYAGFAPQDVVLADFDEDGHLDVPVSQGPDTGILFGDGNGGFGPWTPAVPGVVGRYAAADLNQDGHLDLALQSSVIHVATGDGAGGFSPPTAWVSIGNVAAMVPGDFDGDFRPDIATLGALHLATLLDTNCEARRIGVDAQVSSCATPGQPFAQQPVLGVYDDGGNVVGCDTGVVSASIVPGTGPPGALLGGTTDVPAVAGIATYTDLSITNAAVGYQLQFSHPVAGTTRSRALTIGDPPPPPGASNSGPFCQGQTLNLYATTVPGAVYRWTGPNGFVATVQSPVVPNAPLSAAGVYSVTAIVDGCESAAATTTVDALPAAPAPTILGQRQICFDGTLLLHVDDGAFRHNWYHDGVVIEGVTGPVLTIEHADPSADGDYTVSSSDATGCTTETSAPATVAVAACGAKAMALAVDPAGNGILEPGEAAVVDPTWRNLGVADLTLLGTLGKFTGLSGASYVIQDGTADYGTILPKSEADCLAASGDCYAVTVTPESSRPATHWDAFIDENPGSEFPHAWILHVGDSFADVPASHSFYAFIEAVLHNGITAGCTPTTYCPGNGVTRAQMAVFLLKAKYGAFYVPPAPIQQVFADVPLSNPFAPWITQLAAEGITAGCGNGNYCPNQTVNRAQMAVFLLKTAQVGPPPCTGVFGDVPCPGGFAVDYIETLYTMGVTGGCNTAPLLYCPTNPNTRGQMAVFLTRTFGFTIYGP